MSESIVAVMPYAPDLNLVQESLRGEGVEILFARSPEDALELLTATNASVVIYDADSGQPWREAVPRFLRTRPGSRVVLLSSSSNHRMWMDLYDFGAFDLIVRPFQATEFRGIVRSALNPPKFFCTAA